MSGRTVESSASFRRPVVLKGVDRTLPAGAYRIVTEEAAIDGLSFLAYRRISTAIIVPIGDASEEMATIDPRDLEAALERDRLAFPR
jgi:hypothetical protein